MKPQVPVPGDLIIVEHSEWYALKDGERLRVCEYAGWIEVGEELFVAPRHEVRTFWGPDFGPPNGNLPLRMSTSGGPFKTVKIADLSDLQRVGVERDQFWCWQDRPRAGGGVDRMVDVTVWRTTLLPDGHFRELKRHGCGG